MAFDAFFLRAVIDEMAPTLAAARVEKIHQPSRDTVVVHLRCAQSREKLLFVMNPTAPRLHLTKANPENPDQPPMFCMLLRKHLMGARLASITQPAMERLVRITFDATDEMGFPVQKHLVAELMGRTSNLYLLDQEDRIIDCLRRVGLDSSSRRQALPGLYYQQPEPITKLDPLDLTPADWKDLLSRPGQDQLAGRLMDELGGLSPLVCREAALYAAGETDARPEPTEELAQRLADFFHTQLHHPAPWLYCLPDGTPKAFAFCPIREYGGCTRAESFQALLDSYYTTRDQKDAIRQKGQAVRKTVQNLCQRLRRKMAVQEKERAATLDRERLRQFGDIVTANLHRIQKGQTALLAEDFYDEQMPEISIPLSPLLSPQQNAAKYYKDYARMKNAQRELTHQLELGGAELHYLESVLEELDRAATAPELEEIRQELVSGGYLRPDTGKKRMKQVRSQPMRFESCDGYPIYVGRNNRQNDELTFRLARKDDLWFHAQKMHGSHVILACAGAQPSDEAITQAAQLAAFYAETAHSQNVPVDVTPVKQVKKPNGAKPGMVVYYTYRTVYVNPCGDTSEVPK